MTEAERAMRGLRADHYEACRKEGMTDEQIRKDWEQVLKDLEKYHDEIMGKKSEPTVME